MKKVSVIKSLKKNSRTNYKDESIYCQCCGNKSEEFVEVPFMKKVRVVKKERVVSAEKIKICEDCYKREDKFGLL